MTKAKRRSVKDLVNRFDNISAAFLIGSAILEPHVNMGQPHAPQPSSAAHSRTQEPRKSFTDTTDYAALPPHPQYGNIYSPNHIEHLGGHVFRVVDGQGEPITGRVCWSDALAVTQWRNLGEHPPAVDIIVAYG
jgi:hypothetical protein